MGRKAEKSDARPNPAGLDDQRLVSLVAEGDLHAFETLYRHYFPRLIRFLDHMLRYPPLIEEVINDTMLVVWQKAYAYDASSKVSTWIFGIAYRKALKALRVLDEPVECDFEQFPSEDAHEPENECTQRQLQQTLAQAVDTLAADQRATVNLTYYHGLGYGEIAEIMGCPLNTVKTRMFHARRRLKTLLSGVIEKLS
jgi:RNA polymerase sigma-70 factor (ECF subfamily)